MKKLLFVGIGVYILGFIIVMISVSIFGGNNVEFMSKGELLQTAIT